MHLETLINQAKRGDETAQKLLFNQTHAQLNSVAMRYVIEKSLAEDVLQETYLRIFKNLKKFYYRDEASTLAWMKRIATTESLRILKKQKHWQRSDALSLGDYEIQEDPFTANEMLQMLMLLPPRQRIVFNMFAIEGYNHREIGKHLGIAESSSRSLLTRARAQLQSIISKKKTYEQVY